jgi:hypothetical protein
MISSHRRWAQHAHELVFRDLGNSSVNILMTLVLLCEYYLRHGPQGAVFMVSASSARMLQLLRIEQRSEKKALAAGSAGGSAADADPIVTESLKRLYWAAYIHDVMVGSGVESLLTVARVLPTCKVPKQNADFLIGNSEYCREVVSHVPWRPSPKLGLEAFTARVFYLRNRVLR